MALKYRTLFQMKSGTQIVSQWQSPETDELVHEFLMGIHEMTKEGTEHLDEFKAVLHDDSGTFHVFDDKNNLVVMAAKNVEFLRVEATDGD